MSSGYLCVPEQTWNPSKQFGNKQRKKENLFIIARKGRYKSWLLTDFWAGMQNIEKCYSWI